MGPKFKQFLVEAPFPKRIMVGVGAGAFVAFILSVILVYPQVKTQKNAKEQATLVKAEVEVLEAQETEVKALVESIVQEINSAQLSSSSAIKKPEEVSALMDNLGIAINRSGMTLSSQLELGMVEVESAGGTDKVFQPINVNMNGNLQSTIWFFKMAAETKALAKIKTLKLHTTPETYPDLSASFTLRVQTDERPTAAPPVPQ